MPLPQHEEYTIEDIYNLPEGQRAELIDGQIYMMAPPNRQHQEIVGELYREISNYIRSNHGSCKPYIAPFAVFLNENDKNYVEPDIAVICDRNKLNEKGCLGGLDYRSCFAREPAYGLYDKIVQVSNGWGQGILDR